jgi:hypothetical protein
MKTNNGIAKVAVGTGILAAAYYFFNRFKIEVKEIDSKNKIALVKITIGLKTIERTISGNGSNEEFSLSRNYKAVIQRQFTGGFNIISLSIFKGDEQKDYVEIDFSNQFTPSIIKQR